MAKNDILRGFAFKKMPEISNGLIIPTGNDTRPEKKEIPKAITPTFVKPKEEPLHKNVAQPTKKAEPRAVQPPKRIQIDTKAFTPMTNVVPTIESNDVPTKRNIVVPTVKAKNVPTNRNVVVPSNTKIFKRLSRKAKQRVTHEDLNMAEYGALQTKQDKIVYLSMRGWSLKVEVRGNTLYHYATRYVNRQKKRLYLGSVNTEV
jgi:hypothetical protein